ncbi:class IV adenylate cyclase [bacterium]|nr:class IV adenylate cyclase [bacterium]
MYTETEIKLLFKNLEEAHQKVLRLNSKLQKERHFEDNYVLDTSDLSVRNSGCLLRIRIVSSTDRESCMRSQGILTFKGTLQIHDGIRNREEIECIVDPPETFLEIFERLGYSLKFRYQKYRTIYSIEQMQIHICIDETPIQNYFELEGPAEEIHEIAAKLGYTREQYITESLGQLYYRWCKERGIESSNLVFE